MAFTVEDGTGLANANSYASVAEFKAYHTDRGVQSIVDGDFEDGAIQSALIKATDYMDRRFGSRYKGDAAYPYTPQALGFPRVNLFDRNGFELTGVPAKIKQACAEYALRALEDDLIPDPTVDPSGRAIVGKTDKVGPIESSVTYEPGSAVSNLVRSYPTADMLMQEFVAAIQGSVIR